MVSFIIVIELLSQFAVPERHYDTTNILLTEPRVSLLSQATSRAREGAKPGGADTDTFFTQIVEVLVSGQPRTGDSSAVLRCSKHRCPTC